MYITLSDHKSLMHCCSRPIYKIAHLNKSNIGVGILIQSSNVNMLVAATFVNLNQCLFLMFNNTLKKILNAIKLHGSYKNT